jgi:hypothetical protein
MKYLKNLAYVFLILIIIGLLVHLIEFFSSKTLFGMIIAVVGLIGEICVFALHAREKGIGRKGGGEKFRWKVEHIGVLAIALIVLGIIVNIICSLFFPDYVGIGNGFITLGFIVAVIGFFVYVVKEKGFKS